MMDYEEIKERILRQQLREDRKLTTDELDENQDFCPRCDNSILLWHPEDAEFYCPECATSYRTGGTKNEQGEEETPMDEDIEGAFYQVVCSCGPKTWTEVVSWLAVQIGHKFPTGEVIESIDQFQVIPLNATDAQASAVYRAVATCSVYRPARETE